MLYLIRLDVRQPDNVSLSEFREIWCQDPVAPQEPGDSGAIQSFKVVGRWTVFAIAEFSDNEALDEALAGLPIVENFGSAVEIEVIPVRPYHRLEAPARAPAEEPAQPEDSRIVEDIRDLEDAPEQAAAEPEEPEPEEPAAAARPEQPEDDQEMERPGADQLTQVIPTLEDAPERAPAEPEEPAAVEPEQSEEAGQITQAIRNLEVLRSAPAEPEEPGAGQVTEAVRSLDTPERAPAEPEEPATGPEEAEPEAGIVPEEPAAAAGQEPPEGAGQITQIIHSLDEPGVVPAEPEELAAAARPEQPEEAGQVTEIIRTEVIRSFDVAQGRGLAGPEEPAAVEPEEPTRSEAGQPPTSAAARSGEGSITGAIHGLDAATTKEPAQPEEVVREQPEDAGQVTEAIRSLDVAREGRAPDEPAKESAQPEADQATEAISGLDALEQAPEPEEVRGRDERDTPPGPRILLRAISGPASGETFEVVGQWVIGLGRSPRNHVIVADPKVSPDHALIQFTSNVCWIHDLDAQNGIWVNDRRVAGSVALQDGDVIGIGDTQFVFQITRHAPAASPGQEVHDEAGTFEDERYTRKGFVASGQIDEVYLAHDRELDRDVALKILNKQYADDEQFVERFEREATNAASLSHPNIVAVYDWGETKDGAYYMAMEYMSGGTLEERILEDGPFPAPKAAILALEVARALQAAHERGVIHRDIKPRNVLLTESGKAKVTDFGIARAASASTMTQEGSVLGTAHYISPEQALGQPVSFKSDLYSLGVVLYEMLTGEVPYDARTPVEIVMKHVSGQLRSPKEINPDVPEDINAVVVRLLARDPEERYQDAAELIGELEQMLTGATPGFDAVEEPAQPEEGSVTGMIRDLGASTEEPTRFDEAPQRPAQPEAGQEAPHDDEAPPPPAARSEEGSITGMIRDLGAPEQEPAGPEEQATMVYPTLGQDASHEDPAAAGSEAPSEPRVLLQVVGGPAGGETFEVMGRAGATVGRSSDNSIQIADEKLSRQHARIEFKDGGYWLTDLGSSNGTFVNQDRLEAPHRLQSDDVIGLGSTRLSVTLEAGSAD